MILLKILKLEQTIAAAFEKSSRKNKTAPREDFTKPWLPPHHIPFGICEKEVEMNIVNLDTSFNAICRLLQIAQTQPNRSLGVRRYKALQSEFGKLPQSFPGCIGSSRNALNVTPQRSYLTVVSRKGRRLGQRFKSPVIITQTLLGLGKLQVPNP